MDYLDRAIEYADKAKRALTKTDTEQKLSVALSRTNWGASTTQMREIANLSRDYQEFPVIMKELWSKMSFPPPKWRQVYKALTLLEFLLKHGSDQVLGEAQHKMSKIKRLKSFSFDEDGTERGSGIRTKAKIIIELVQNSSLLESERRKARELKNKYTGTGSNGFYPKNTYEKSSYDNDSFYDEPQRKKDSSDDMFAAIEKSKEKIVNEETKPTEPKPKSKLKIQLKQSFNSNSSVPQTNLPTTKPPVDDLDDLLGDLQLETPQPKPQSPIKANASADKDDLFLDFGTPKAETKSVVETKRSAVQDDLDDLFSAAIAKDMQTRNNADIEKKKDADILDFFS